MPLADAGDLARSTGARRSTARAVLRLLARDRAAVLGFGLFFVIAGAALLAPLLAPHDPNALKMPDRFQGPSLRYPLGTDELGRDLLSRLMYGARVSMSVGVISVGLAAGVGTVLGLVGAYYGGRFDTVVMRLMDGLLAFPAIILALAIMTALGPSMTNAMIAIGVSATPIFVRLTRGQVINVKVEDYIEAARAMGNPRWRIALFHILPNIMPALLVQATLSIAAAIIAEAALSFLGLGQQPPEPSWGSMLNAAQRFLSNAPWMAVWPGLAIFLVVLSFNLVGDGMHDALDPRER
jgi:peptide/nickel transport system permease protein